MGGKEGARGYLYQTIVTVLGSLLDESWKYVQVEPDTNHDKVDILWKGEGDATKVVQVKSSQNNIEKSQIINWLEQLIADVSDANEYELLLIGNVSDTTSKFISKLNRLSEHDEVDEEDTDYKSLQRLKGFLSKIHVTLENFNLDSLESRIQVNVNKLLTKMGHLVNPFVIEQIMGGLIYQFNKFSTEGKQVSRESYLSTFQQWVYYNYPEIKGNGLIKKSLAVEFYLKNYIDFQVETKGFKFQKDIALRTYKEELLTLIEKINKMTLPQKSSKNSVENISNLSINFMGEYHFMEYSDELKDKLIEMTKKLLGVDITKEFFYVGDLKKVNNNISNPLFSGPEPKGTEQEKEKDSLIREYHRELIKYKDIHNYLSYLEGFSAFPLVLRNVGLTSEEEIEVTLTFPKEVEVITKENIKAPNTNIIEFFDGETGFFNSLLTPSKDHKVEEYYSDYLAPFNHYPEPLTLFESAQERTRRKVESFIDYIDNLFQQEVFDEGDFTIIRYYFKALNSKKNMHFPSFLLLKVENECSIHYEITSKNIGDHITGDLYISI